MSRHSPTASADNDYTGRITRQLVEKAEDLFETALDARALEPLLEQVTQHAEHLSDSERQQLQELARLMQQAQALGTGGEGASLELPGEFELNTEQDHMLLLLTVRAPVAGGKAATVDEVLDWLRERQINTGVDIKAIRQAVADAAGGQDVHDVVIVRGRAARAGRDARIERFGRKTADSPLIALSDHLLETSDAWMCKTGDLVLRYHPPEPGEPGYNALGETIDPPAPQAIDVQTGRHVRIDGHDYHADVAGVVCFQDHRVEVRKALIFHQDLTHKSEPIDFDGEVHVHAAVRSRVHIRASGNVIIDGPVEGAEIESTDADVTLRSGVAGQGAAVIRAARDINARFAERASLFAGRNITLQVGSLHSRLIAHEQVVAIQGKGHLAGGVVMAGEKVSVKQLGARGGVRTDVTVGLSREVLQHLAEIDQLVARATQRRDAAADLADQIRRAVGDPLKLSARELHVYTRLQQLQLVCDVQIRKLHERRKELLVECARVGAGKVEVMTSIMSNVGVTIGSADVELDSRPGPCTLSFSEASNSVVVRRA